MDHLLLPLNPTLPPITIPFITTIHRSPLGDFLTYPDRSGFRALLNNPKPDLSSSSLSSIGPSIQKWLFFGLLEAVTRISRPVDYVRAASSGQGRVVTTASLYEHVEKLFDYYLESDNATAVRHYQYANECLYEAYTTLERLRDIDDERLKLDQHVHLSIAVLGEFLQDVDLFARSMLKVPAGQYTVIPCRWAVGNVIHDHPIAQQMIEQGWCRRQLLTLDRMRLSTLYFVSRLERPQGNSKSHRECTLYSCKYEKIDETAYVTKHTTDDCDCRHEEFPRDILTQMVAAGSLPLVTVDVSLTDPHITFTATARSAPWSKMPWVTISHVWSDGLGNPHRNSLPRCQIYALALRVAIATGQSPTNARVTFWMDTLCCPVAPPETRSKVISLMRDIYTGADQVVVIDAWLAGTKEQASPRTVAEVCMRIVVSDWNSRLWTLQEGALARRLQVAFGNSMVDLSMEYFADFVQFCNGKAWAVNVELRDVMLKLRGMALHKDVSEDETFRSIFESLRFRMTTKSSDEAVCTATLFGLDASDVVRTRGETDIEKHEQRMVKFWGKMRRIPCELLWDLAGETLRIDGFRWAPTSLRGSSIIGMREERSAFATLYQPDPTRGVVFQCPGILLNCPDHQVHDEFFLKNERGRWHRVNRISIELLRRCSAEGISDIRDPSVQVPYNPWILEDGRRNSGRPIAHKGPFSLALIGADSLNEADFLETVILAAVEESNDSEIFVRGCCKTAVMEIRDPSHISYLNVMFNEHEKTERTRPAPFGLEANAVRYIRGTKRLPGTQRWVLD